VVVQPVDGTSDLLLTGRGFDCSVDEHLRDYSGQVVYTIVPLSLKQYNLVPAKDDDGL